MQDNAIVPYSNIDKYEDDGCSYVRVVRRNKRRKNKKSRWGVLFSIILLVVLFIFMYSKNDFIKAHTDSFILKIKNTLFSYDDGDENDRNGDGEKDENENGNGGKGEPGSGDDGNGDTSDDNPNGDKENGDNSQPKGDYLINESNIAYSNKFYNETSYPVVLSSLSYIRPNIKNIYSVYGDTAPVVLIIHSNATEAYSDGISYSKGDSFYSEEENVASLGKVMTEILNENGINAIHIDNVFGNGVIHNSGKEYKNTVASMLQQYPSISYIFDISRDVIINSDMSMTKPVFQNGDKKYAQVKFSVGSDKISENKNWQSNLAFTYILSDFVSQKSKDLIYKYELSSFSLKQNNDTLSLKIDIGAYSNTYKEAYESTVILSDYLADFLRNQ